MKALRTRVRFVVAGVLLVGVAFVITVASFGAGFNARCKTGNMIGPKTPERIKRDYRDLGWSWMNHALNCKVGDYEIAVPSGSGQGQGTYILRKGAPFVIVTERDTELFNDTGDRILFSITPAQPGGVSMLSYSGYDQAKGATIENWDAGADGSVDYRTTSVKGRVVKREARVGEQWLEILERDGRSGVVVDGQFMPVPDAVKLTAHQ